MQVEERHSSALEAGSTGYLTIEVKAGGEAAKSGDRTQPGPAETYRAKEVKRAETAPMFALAQHWPTPLPERYPRLTILAISLLLLISSLTVEFEYLRGAGYTWP